MNMDIDKQVSTGMKGFDEVIDMLRLEDNVVWQVESINDYRKIVDPYVEQAIKDNRNLIYIRFGTYDPLVKEEDATKIYDVDASEGFESFAMKIHNIIEYEGLKAFYVFDCLSDLLKSWYSDLMIGNFFKVTCPFLYQLDTVAYFALVRKAHTYDTIARIRETTQLLLDLYIIQEKVYIHPLKVWERYSPTMFFPHLVEGDNATCITASAQAAQLFSNLRWSKDAMDYWEHILVEAGNTLSKSERKQQKEKHLLMELIIGKESRIYNLCDKYFTLEDTLFIARKVIGSGRIGGKSVGMLIARKILKTDAWDTLMDHWEADDSYYLGADVFYTYIVQNDLWKLRVKQKTKDGYYKYAPELKEKLKTGTFPKHIQEQFMQVLEYFGQSPVIVRSSSLLEDNYGNAFAGKYDSVFLVNQGIPEERYKAFEDAVRTVYASTMNQDALAYRENRGLMEHDEQMAILIQRVSGDHYKYTYFPHIAGVGNSVNLYVWNKGMDPNAGMLRMVFGLGTRAVDRVSGDYARIVALDAPDKTPPTNYGDEKKFSQHKMDLLNLMDNELQEMPVEKISDYDIKTDRRIFFTPDYAQESYLRQLGYNRPIPMLLDFKKLLGGEFSAIMRTILSTLTKAYDYPVDIEFTANFTSPSAIAPDGTMKINLLQCRPLQTRGFGAPVKKPSPKAESLFYKTEGNFMGGNVWLPVDYVIFVNGKEYINLSLPDKYQVARYVGILNEKLKGRQAMLIGPGRWGTTTPTLGVPVHFTEVCNMTILCELAYLEEGLMPELSFGSHFFQDIVESNIFYSAVFDGDKDVMFRSSYILDKKNLVEEYLSIEAPFIDTIHVVDTKGLTLYADILTQKLMCFEKL